jgi:hypothetical protein
MHEVELWELINKSALISNVHVHEAPQRSEACLQEVVLYLETTVSRGAGRPQCPGRRSQDSKHLQTRSFTAAVSEPSDQRVPPPGCLSAAHGHDAGDENDRAQGQTMQNGGSPGTSAATAVTTRRVATTPVVRNIHSLRSGRRHKQTQLSCTILLYILPESRVRSVGRAYMLPAQQSSNNFRHCNGQPL